MKHNRDLCESDPRVDVMAQCLGKDPLSFAQAQKIAKRMSSKGRIVNAYRCHACGAWHVGQPSAVKRIRNRK